ncbi:hypothetical protein KSZ_27950 [Dictyobacter formicarum]|uniref:Uncharacterized protein n=1 Tax=Dictyobacter formicarum TaxID=2778368 RepID=A0ABQ3VGG5_9CHLR|nr:hypothetical protein KSZ_27950 [Dictyobacter formicarum]
MSECQTVRAFGPSHYAPSELKMLYVIVKKCAWRTFSQSHTTVLLQEARNARFLQNCYSSVVLRKKASAAG